MGSKFTMSRKKINGDTTNMRNFVARWHPEVGERTEISGVANQTTITTTLTNLPVQLERATEKSILFFFAKDLHLYRTSLLKMLDSVVCCCWVKPKYVVTTPDTVWDQLAVDDTFVFTIKYNIRFD